MNAWLRVVLLSVGLGAMPVLAEDPDSVGLGTGRDGPLTVTKEGQVINRYAQVTGPVAPGDDVLLVENATGFSAGELVMVLQVTGLVPELSPGMSMPLVISQDAVGQWEFARLARVGDGALTLTKPLVHPYAAQVTQIIRVPEYTRVHVQKDASLRAVPWNGHTGGVIAFLATETLHNEGELSATGAGFRGGSHVLDSFSPMVCRGDMVVGAMIGGQKGEGVAVTQYAPPKTGREAASNGGGGGVCPMAGGGGGGNGESGGNGEGAIEFGEDRLDLGGQGGTKLVYSMPAHLFFGGGGGGGYGTELFTPKGGSGGGILLARARELIGEGSITADGEAGEAASAGGAGGGGAGGSISLRFTGSAMCDVVSARGGAGGAVGPHYMGRGGAGGGGGGGQVTLLADFHGRCPLLVDSGLTGNPLTPVVNHTSQEARLGSEDQSVRVGLGTTAPDSGCPGNYFKIDFPTDGGVVTTDGGLVVRGTMPHGVANVTVVFDGKPMVPYATLDKANGRWNATFQKLIPEGWDGGEGVTEFAHDASYKIKAASSGDGGSCTNMETQEFQFLVDLVPPDIEIEPGDRSVRRKAKQADFMLSSNARDFSRFECVLKNLGDNSSSACSCSRNGSDGGVFQGSAHCENVGEGPHVLSVKAFDNAGNVQEEASPSWVVDNEAPKIVFKVPVNNEYINTGLPYFLGQLAPSQALEDKDAVLIFMDGGVDGGVNVPVDRYGRWSFFVSDKPMSDGTYNVNARGTDDLGNLGPIVSVSFTIDTKTPKAEVVKGPRNPNRSKKSEFIFAAKEDSSLVEDAEFECQLDREAFVPCLKVASFEDLGNGEHTLLVRAKDKAGNVEDMERPEKKEPYKWEVQVVQPAPPVITEPISGSTIDTTTFFVSGQAVLDGLKGDVSVAIDGRQVGAVASVDADGVWRLQIPFQLEPGSHSLSAKIKDENENVSDASSEVKFVVVIPDGNVGRAIGGGLGCSSSRGVGALYWILALFVPIVSRRRRRSEWN